MNIERGSGFALLILGVGLIVYSLYSSFQIFTGVVQPPEIFSPVEKPFQQETSQDGGAQEQVKQLLAEQLENILPADTIPKVLNISMWSVFAGLLLFGGAQIAGIGIKLLKTEKIARQ